LIDYCGLKLKNPFIIASGPITNTIEKLRLADKYGASGVSTKLSFFERPFKGSVRYYSEPEFGGIVSSDSRMEFKELQRLVERAKKETDLIIFCNITHKSNDINGWVQMGRGLEEAGADALELNFNCPNITLQEKQIHDSDEKNYGALLGQSKKACQNIIRSLKENISIPVIPKLTYRVADISQMAVNCQQAGADGVILASGYPSLPPVDIYNRGRLLNKYHSGLSIGSLGGSRANLMHSFANVALVYKKTNLPIIGGGGIRTWEDGVQMMMWGATLITACWLVMFKGFEIVEIFLKKMEKFLDEQGYNSYEDLVGISVPFLMSGSQIKVEPNHAEVDQELCQKCLKCLRIGHCEAITQINGCVQVDSKKCTGCTVCETICPFGAISMVKG